MGVTMKLLAMLLMAAAVSVSAQTYEQLTRDMRTAYDAKDYPRFLTVVQRMNAVRPNHPSIMANMAGAYALNGRPEDAIAILRRLVAMQVFIDTRDTDFDAIRSDERFIEAAGRLAELHGQRIAGATVAFRIPQKGLITEGLAYDPVTRSFFVSSARKGTVHRIDRSGVARAFPIDGGRGVHSLSGIGVDATRRILWACSTASPRWESYTKGDPNDAALVGFDLKTGALVKQVRPADAGAFFDDLTVAADGTVYVSDSTGAVLRLRPGANALETVVPRGVIRSPQGLVLSADGKLLYVADYGGPIRAVDLRMGDVAPLAMPDDFQSMGIDGLERAGRSLIAVQNGIEPNRVVSLDLSPDGLKILRATVLEMNHPLIDEPTIGKVVRGTYYFVGTSQGNKFDRGQPDVEKLSDGLVFRVPLAGE